MRRISSGVEQLLTADEIADAILTYATSLARAGTADTITIPIVRDDGGTDTARMLLGPASQLTIVPDGDDDTDLPGAAEILDDLRRRTVQLEPGRSPVRSTDDDADVDATTAVSFPDFDGHG